VKNWLVKKIKLQVVVLVVWRNHFLVFSIIVLRFVVWQMTVAELT